VADAGMRAMLILAVQRSTVDVFDRKTGAAAIALSSLAMVIVMFCMEISGMMSLGDRSWRYLSGVATAISKAW
jgi:hypothetical protein